MRRNCKFVCIPVELYSNADLSITEKWVLLSIDSYCQGQGVAMGIRAIASDTNLPDKTVREILKELHAKGALDVSVGDNGEKIIKPLLYKERYVSNGNRMTVGDKPTDAVVINWDEISQKWKEYCSELPEISRWTPNRKQKLRGSMRQAGIAIQDLYKAFAIIGATPFLCGKNDRGWRATFDWVIGSSMHITKILEGQYSHSPSEKQEYERIIKGEPQIKAQNDIFYR